MLSQILLPLTNLRDQGSQRACGVKIHYTEEGKKKLAHTQKKSVSAVQIVRKWNTELLSDGRPKMADDFWDSSLPL